MEGPFFIVSDNHFYMQNDSYEQKRRNKLFQVFDKIKSHKKGTLIIGGDFFDFWFETNNAVPKGYGNLIQALSDLENNTLLQTDLKIESSLVDDSIRFIEIENWINNLL